MQGFNILGHSNAIATKRLVEIRGRIPNGMFSLKICSNNIVFKVAKAREQLEEAKRTYEQLNSELHDELPALNDSRVLFLVTNLQTLFAAEQVFHSETAKVRSHKQTSQLHVTITKPFNNTTLSKSLILYD